MSATISEKSANSALRVADDLAELIGNTPMLRLKRLARAGGGDVYAKLEFLNPGGSVKDRAALGILWTPKSAAPFSQVEPWSRRRPATLAWGWRWSASTAAIAWCCLCRRGFAEEKCMLMRGLGAEVHRTPEAGGMLEAIRMAKELVAQTPGAMMAGQFENQANPDYHAVTTAREILDQMEGRVDGFVAGSGTGGTFSGVARTLKRECPGVRTVVVETEGSVLGGGPKGPHKVEGIGASFVPATFDYSVADKIQMVTDVDAFAMVARLGREEGLLAGSSAGAAVFAAVELAATMQPGQRVVTIIPDSAERYLSKKIFEGGV